MVQPGSPVLTVAARSARRAASGFSAMTVTCTGAPAVCGAATSIPTSTSMRSPGPGPVTTAGCGVVTAGPSTRTVTWLPAPGGRPAVPLSPPSRVTRTIASGRAGLPPNSSVEVTSLICMPHRPTNPGGGRGSACQNNRFERSVSKHVFRRTADAGPGGPSAHRGAGPEGDAGAGPPAPDGPARGHRQRRDQDADRDRGQRAPRRVTGQLRLPPAHPGQVRVRRGGGRRPGPGAPVAAEVPRPRARPAVAGHRGQAPGARRRVGLDRPLAGPGQGAADAGHRLPGPLAGGDARLPDGPLPDRPGGQGPGCGQARAGRAVPGTAG